MKTRGGNAHRSRQRETPSHRFRTQNPCPEDPDMSDPFAPREDSWPLGLVPSLGISVPHLLAILATAPTFNTPFAALGLPVPVFGKGDPASVHAPGSDALGIVVDAGPGVSTVKVGQAV